uniref:3-hydroxyisobutyryl-CoA hydrolase, mitochondrial n=1 Tax=Strigamia maritima TaxID=126957 RepID=T1J530_STRMM
MSPHRARKRLTDKDFVFDEVVYLYALSTGADDIIFQQMSNNQKIGVMTLNRPKALNSLNLSMISQINSQLKKWQSEIAFVIIKGSGGKAFCAGADIRGCRFFNSWEVQGCNRKHCICYAGDSHRLPDHLRMYYELTGHRVIGVDLLKNGLATHYCDFNKSVECKEKLAASRTKISKNIFLSPTSLKVTIAVLRQATKFSLQECLKMDFRVMTRLVFEKDFLEGVRASVIDKDNKPNWNPSALKPVSEEKFQSILAPLQADKEQSFKYDNYTFNSLMMKWLWCLCQ